MYEVYFLLNQLDRYANTDLAVLSLIHYFLQTTEQCLFKRRFTNKIDQYVSYCDIWGFKVDSFTPGVHKKVIHT